jgi:hypothetical protein
MSRQFETTLLQDGNLIVTGGWVKEAKSSARIYVADGATDTTPGAMQVPIGGSGRNVRITGLLNDTFEAIGEQDFIGRILSGWSLTYGDNGTVSLSDGTNVVASAAAGTVPIPRRLPCSAAGEYGGDGGGEYTVDLGSATGTVSLAFDAYSVPDRFIVEWNGSEVINSGLRGVNGTYDGNVVVVDGAGAGTLTFNKTTASPSTAIVRVVSPYSGTSWSFTLGCPGGGSPPYPVSTLADWGTFTLASTSYGQTTYNSGTAFTLTARVEKALVTMLGADVLPLAGSAFSGAMSRRDPGVFVGVSDTDWTLSLNSLGYSSYISDGIDIVATRSAGSYPWDPILAYDPSGYYTATTYGAATYNGGAAYGTHVGQSPGSPMQGRSYLLITESAPGTIDTAKGPFFGPSLPAAADPVYPVEIAEVTSLGERVQVQDGTVLWAASGGGGGATIVEIGLADFEALSPPTAGTFYAITGP